MEERLIIQASYVNQRSLLAGFILPWLTAGGIHLLKGNIVSLSVLIFVLVRLSVAQELD